MKKCDHIVGYGEWWTGNYPEGEQIVTEIHCDEDKIDHKHDDMDYFFNPFKYCPECGVKLKEKK